MRSPNSYWLTKYVRLEGFLALATIGLIFQLAPQTVDFVSGVIAERASRILAVLDVRQWPRVAWLVLNVLFVLAMLGIRFRSELGRAAKRVVRSMESPRGSPKDYCVDEDYEARRKRDEEWRERARKRLPYN